MATARPSPLNAYDMEHFTHKYDMRLFVEAYNQAAGGPDALNMSRADYLIVSPDGTKPRTTNQQLAKIKLNSKLMNTLGLESNN